MDVGGKGKRKRTARVRFSEIALHGVVSSGTKSQTPPSVLVAGTRGSNGAVSPFRKSPPCYRGLAENATLPTVNRKPKQTERGNGESRAAATPTPHGVHPPLSDKVLRLFRLLSRRNAHSLNRQSELPCSCLHPRGIFVNTLVHK